LNPIRLLLRKLIQYGLGGERSIWLGWDDLDFGGKSILNPNFVDGVDVSALPSFLAVKMAHGEWSTTATSPNYVWETEVLMPVGAKKVRLRLYSRVDGGTGYIQLVSRYPEEKVLATIEVTRTTYDIEDTGDVPLVGDEHGFIIKAYITPSSPGQAVYFTNPLLVFKYG